MKNNVCGFLKTKSVTRRSAAGSASRSGREGRGFKSRRLDQKCRNLSKRQIAAFAFYKVGIGIIIEMNGRWSYGK
nr:MAG TPA: hypothetical protein [Caudoviricetes sp.]